MNEPKVYLNGHIVSAGQAAISVYDTGLLHGASAFTTMLAHNGRVFRLDRHLRRLRETAELLSFREVVEAAQLCEAVDGVLAANELSSARVRATLTPGSVRGDEPTVLVTAEHLPEYPDPWYREGVTVTISPFKQILGDPTFGHKTGCYLPRILARQEAASKGAEEALWYTTENLLAEACFCNVFLVLGGRVLTPPRDTPVLPGVVREAVLELCKSMEIPHDSDTSLTVREMLDAEEAFLTSSCSGVRPIARIERHEVGAERPGPVTARLMTAYRDLLERECPPA
jgi:branched-subunit amino acid aminotransferase/4-amino-4-deoxychorismate lyase